MSSYDSLDVVKALHRLKKICENTQNCDDCIIVKISGITPYFDCATILQTPSHNELVKNYVKYHKHK